jgi:hypothetical protein
MEILSVCFDRLGGRANGAPLAKAGREAALEEWSRTMGGQYMLELCVLATRPSPGYCGLDFSSGKGWLKAIS